MGFRRENDANSYPFVCTRGRSRDLSACSEPVSRGAGCVNRARPDIEAIDAPGIRDCMPFA